MNVLADGYDLNGIRSIARLEAKGQRTYVQHTTIIEQITQTISSCGLGDQDKRTTVSRILVQLIELLSYLKSEKVPDALSVKIKINDWLESIKALVDSQSHDSIELYNYRLAQSYLNNFDRIVNYNCNNNNNNNNKIDYMYIYRLNKSIIEEKFFERLPPLSQEDQDTRGEDSFNVVNTLEGPVADCFTNSNNLMAMTQALLLELLEKGGMSDPRTFTILSLIFDRKDTHPPPALLILTTFAKNIELVELFIHHLKNGVTNRAAGGADENAVYILINDICSNPLLNPQSIIQIFESYQFIAINGLSRGDGEISPDDGEVKLFANLFGVSFNEEKEYVICDIVEKMVPFINLLKELLGLPNS